jgi:hypothetical protein
MRHRFAASASALAASAFGLLFASLNGEPPRPAPAGGPSPKLVTLQGDKIPLSKALDELNRQAGEPVADRRNEPDVDLKLDLKQVAFWQALDAVADAAGARVDLHARDGRLALLKRLPTEKAPPVSYSGLFRTTVRRVAAAHDFETDHTSYAASLEVAWEPHFRPFLLETRPHNLVVRDDKGNDLRADNEGSSVAPVDGRIALAFDVPVPPAPRASKRLGLLEGELYAVGPSKMLTFPEEKANEAQKWAPLGQLAKTGPRDSSRWLVQEGVTCGLSKLVLDDDHWTIQVTLEYPEGNVKLDSYQSWVVNNELYLESTDGKARLAPETYLLESSTPRRAVLSYHFTDKEKMKSGPGAWRPVYRAPASVVKVPFSFSFTNVELP